MFNSWGDDDEKEHDVERFEFSGVKVEGRDTDKAVMLDVGNKRQWFPKSQLQWEGKNLWSVPVWLAEKKGLC
jgi:hypothetical protein